MRSCPRNPSGNHWWKEGICIGTYNHEPALPYAGKYFFHKRLHCVRCGETICFSWDLSHPKTYEEIFGKDPLF